MTSRLLLLDTASLYYRAFFGVPDSLKAPDGTVVNALRGLLDFVANLAKQYEPDAIVACWDDDWRPDWRVDLIPTYKAHRVVEEAEVDVEETPDLLVPQVPLIAEALGLVGIPVIGAPEAEADDVIGTLVHRWSGPVDVVTGDRDLFQLVSPTVSVLYTARGVSKHDVVDAEWVRAKYGIDPGQYVDFAVMRGDASDGLPGVAGIGDKTAAVLLAEFGDLDGILAAAEDPDSSIKPRVRANLLASLEYIAAARTVVTVLPDLPLDVPALGPIDSAFPDFAARWGLGSVADRLTTALPPR